jgi:adenosylmethionine-8-amino-7-oxononanoate aminotransferase
MVRTMTHILHRQISGELPVAVGGDGVFLQDATGKKYIDASGGAAVSCLGHSSTDVKQAIRDQLDRLAYAHTSFFTTEVAEELADTLIADAPAGLSHVYFVSGGSEAVEAALKMARQYFVERGEPQRRFFIAREQSYHGNTLGALSVGGNLGRRKMFAPVLIEARHIEPCFSYRHRRPDESEEQYGKRAADALETAIGNSAPKMSSALLRRPSSERPRARCLLRPAISSASAKSATGTASCSFLTR